MGQDSVTVTFLQAMPWWHQPSSWDDHCSLNTAAGDTANAGESLGPSGCTQPLTEGWSQGCVDLVPVSCGQCGLDLFFSLEPQKGNLLPFWCLCALKLILLTLPQQQRWKSQDKGEKC